MDFADSLTQLNILISNTTGFAFNADEVNQMLTDAWNDKYAVNPLVWDSSLTFDATTPTFRYLIPATLTTVSGVYITRSSTNAAELVDDSLWEVVGNYLQFNDRALQSIPDGYTLYLRGRYKVSVSDTISDIGLQEYIVNLAAYNALKYLLLKRTIAFLKTDTSVAEIVAAKREFYADTVRWRQQLQSEFIGV